MKSDASTSRLVTQSCAGPTSQNLVGTQASGGRIDNGSNQSMTSQTGGSKRLNDNENSRTVGVQVRQPSVHRTTLTALESAAARQELAKVPFDMAYSSTLPTTSTSTDDGRDQPDHLRWELKCRADVVSHNGTSEASAPVQMKVDNHSNNCLDIGTPADYSVCGGGEILQAPCVAPYKHAGGQILQEPFCSTQVSGGGTEYPFRGEASSYERDLAVATPVAIEESSDLYIPTAIQQDYGAKPPVQKKRQMTVLALMGLLLILCCTVAVLSKKLPHESLPGPSFAPSTFRQSLGIEEKIMNSVGNILLSDEESSYVKALNWIVEEDPLRLDADSHNLVQRYVLTTFYFETSKHQPWRSCNPPSGINTESSMRCISSKTSFNQGEALSVAWLTGAHECDWAGVYCVGNKTLALEVASQQLSGTLPTVLEHLAFLRVLSLPWNELSGTLPPGFGSALENLVSIQLDYNLLTGSIPDQWSSLSKLERLSISENMVSGSLPPELSELRNIKSLYVDRNHLTGPIPSEYGKMTSLLYLRLHKNNLAGIIPSNIGGLTNLLELWLHQNVWMTGPLPSEIGRITKLRDVRMSEAGVGGQIPEELFNLPLVNLDLSNSNFVGSISSNIGRLTKLTNLRLRGNTFSGTIPFQLGDLSQLTVAWFHLNSFSGSIPETLCNLTHSSKEGETFLKELVADCTPKDKGASVRCDRNCCTECCNNESMVCVERLQ